MLKENKLKQSGQYRPVDVYWKLDDAGKVQLAENYLASDAADAALKAQYSEKTLTAAIVNNDGALQFALKGYYKALSNEEKIAQSGAKALNGNAVSYSDLSDAAKEMLSRYYVANNWDFAKALAQGDTAGGAGEGDTYLATITTSLENSLVSQGKENPLFVGGKGSGNPTTANPTAADKDHTDGYYWVTGPEGLANDGKGTKFASNDARRRTIPMRNGTAAHRPSRSIRNKSRTTPARTYLSVLASPHIGTMSARKPARREALSRKPIWYILDSSSTAKVARSICRAMSAIPAR